MLVLSRKLFEAIDLTTKDGTAISILVVEIRDGHKVRLGIEAPAHVTINRREVTEAIAREKGDGNVKSDR